MADDERREQDITEDNQIRERRTTEDQTRAGERADEDLDDLIHQHRLAAEPDTDRVRMRPLGKLGKLPWFPYETLIGLLVLISGLSELLKPDPTERGLGEPQWLETMIAGLFLVTGLLLLLGLWRSSIRTELTGQFMLILTVVISTTDTILYNDRGALEAELLLIAVIWAAGVRIYEVARGRILVQIEKDE